VSGGPEGRRRTTRRLPLIGDENHTPRKTQILSRRCLPRKSVRTVTTAEFAQSDRLSKNIE
jgi:hypothetical protein